MNCPVCNRNNAVTLSICPSCGAMIDDSVREELKPKTSSHIKPIDYQTKKSQSLSNKAKAPPADVNPPKTNLVRKPITARLTIKPTSQTLVEFHNKNAAVPEWRLQLQNAVRKRQDRIETDFDEERAAFVPQTKLVTSGANALKAEILPESEPIHSQNPTLNSALERIEKSRRQFLAEETTETEPPVTPSAPNKNYPFYIASKQTEVAPSAANKASVNPPPRPKLATSLRTDLGEPINTNKLPPLPEPAKISTSFAERPLEIVEDTIPAEIEVVEQTGAVIVEKPILSEIAESEESEIEENDDLAPFAMRFNAGLFDFIIGAFAALILLSPFMIRGESWFSFSGFLTFAAVCAVIMFAYMTVAIGFYGRTFGMRLFSLELIDIDGENYPTIHQAAVSSSVYLLSMAFGGVGFLTLFFNDEKRAAHDLISKTIIVREF